MENTNAVYLAKQGWKILTQPNNIWVQLVKVKDLKNNTHNYLQINKTNQAFSAWESILIIEIFLVKDFYGFQEMEIT